MQPAATTARPTCVVGTEETGYRVPCQWCAAVSPLDRPMASAVPPTAPLVVLASARRVARPRRRFAVSTGAVVRWEPHAMACTTAQHTACHYREQRGDVHAVLAPWGMDSFAVKLKGYRMYYSNSIYTMSNYTHIDCRLLMSLLSLISLSVNTSQERQHCKHMRHLYEIGEEK